jgi:hypothetical protein
MARNPTLCKFRKRYLQEVLKAESSSPRNYEADVELAEMVVSKPDNSGLHTHETHVQLANQTSDFVLSSNSSSQETLELKNESAILKNDSSEPKKMLDSRKVVASILRPND